MTASLSACCRAHGFAIAFAADALGVVAASDGAAM